MSSSARWTAFSDAPAGRSVPSSVLAEAAASYNDEWHKKLAPVPGRLAHMRLVFDGASAPRLGLSCTDPPLNFLLAADDVSLLYWHKALRLERAGLELDGESVPTPAQVRLALLTTFARAREADLT